MNVTDVVNGGGRCQDKNRGNAKYLLVYNIFYQISGQIIGAIV